MELPLSRRELLGSGVVAGAVAVTGCLGRGSVPLGDANAVGGLGSYTDWLPEPGLVGTADHYNFHVFDLADIRDQEESFEEELYEMFEGFESGWRFVDVDFDEMEALVFSRFGSVLAATFERADLEDDLSDDEYDDEGDHEGYTVLYSPEAGRAFGIGDEVIVSTRTMSNVPAEDIIVDLLDTKLGEEERYVEENDDCQVLTDQLGVGTYVYGGTHEERTATTSRSEAFEETVAAGYRLGVDGETTTFAYVIVYEDESDVDQRDLEEWADDAQLHEDLSDLSLSIDGRSATAAASIDTDDVDSSFFS